MMEKNTPSYKTFEKKIVPYLDGSLSKEETSEFEAFVLTHPEFEEKIKTKQEEIQQLKDMMPAARLALESKESLENEIKSSIYNLLKEEPKGLLDSIRIKWEEFVTARK
jgi:glutathione peroxidase-family protein